MVTTTVDTHDSVVKACIVGVEQYFAPFPKVSIVAYTSPFVEPLLRLAVQRAQTMAAARFSVFGDALMVALEIKIALQLFV